jgi:hypothetical protein
MPGGAATARRAMHAKSINNALERAWSAKSGAKRFLAIQAVLNPHSEIGRSRIGTHYFSVAPSTRECRGRATNLPDDSTTKLLQWGIRIGAAMMRSGSNLIMNATLIVGISALLLLGTILVRSVATTDKGGQATADITLADLRGTVP